MEKNKIYNEFAEITRLIEDARNRAFQKVNEELILLYYKVGGIVSSKVAVGSWGDNTVGELANYMQQNYSDYSGFTRRGLYRMKQFYEDYSSDNFIKPLTSQLEALFPVNKLDNLLSALPTQSEEQKPVEINVTALPTQIHNYEKQILSSLLCKVTWSNHLEILSKTKTPEEKLFYLLNCIKERWTMRDLRRQLNSAYYERTMLSNQKIPAETTDLPQNIFKDPYIFEFLDLPDTHTEKELEKAIILNLQKFILEIGKGFTYMGNQFRLQIGNKDYYTDLLFYHRDLRCLVMFELKIQEFEPEFLGKLNFYLEALDRDVKLPHENQSIGVLLCKGKDIEVVEYAMARNTSPTIITDYETKLIAKNLLANKLHQLIEQFSKEE